MTLQSRLQFRGSVGNERDVGTLLVANYGCGSGATVTLLRKRGRV